jgi:hypothetical protein
MAVENWPFFSYSFVFFHDSIKLWKKNNTKTARKKNLKYKKKISERFLWQTSLLGVSVFWIPLIVNQSPETLFRSKVHIVISGYFPPTLSLEIRITHTHTI